MAGHSHWAKVKRAKGATDIKRGQLFSKLSKEISVAARLGGGDSNFNPRLRTAITAARAESMPADNIERAIKKGTGELEGSSYEEIFYEGYGPGGVALLVETTTDNKNRTAAEVRACFSKYNGNMGGSGSVSWMFKKKALFLLNEASEDAVLEATLDAGPDDIKAIPNSKEIEVISAPEKFDAIENALKKADQSIQSSKLTFIPDNLTAITSEDTARSLFVLLEKLEENEDVQNVYANFDISDEIMTKIQA